MTFTYYCVAAGRVPGVYRSWKACNAQIDSWKGRIFKGHYSRASAHKWMCKMGAEEHSFPGESDRLAAEAAKAAAEKAACELSGKRWGEYLSSTGTLLNAIEGKGWTETVNIARFGDVDPKQRTTVAPVVGGLFMDAGELLRARRAAAEVKQRIAANKERALTLRRERRASNGGVGSTSVSELCKCIPFQ